MTARRLLIRRFVVLVLLLILLVGVAGSWTLAWLGQGPVLNGPPPDPGQIFQVEPYLQAGDGREGTAESLALLWQTDDHDAAWSVDVRAGAGKPWANMAPPRARRIAVEGLPAFRLYRATLAGQTRGSGFAYRVGRGGVPVFEAEARARPVAGRPQRFVSFGDCAAGTPEQAAVAYQTHLARPDYLVITGDIVYNRGRVAEYLDHFFRVYNAPQPAQAVGAPLLRSIVTYAAPGNHDLVESNLDRFPDGLAYFYYWTPPRNGPLTDPDAPGAPPLKAASARRLAFLEATDHAFPRTASFSFDEGDVHWTVLDSNTYADWSTPALRQWLEADLASPPALRATWRFMAFHHPPFSSSRAHADDQRMRLVAPILERGKVDLVFSGHVHNYQRSRPVRFVPGPPPPGSGGLPHGPEGQVPGTWSLDRSYDGANRTRPDGIIYVVNGGGGAKLYDPTQGDEPGSWQPFTVRFVSKVHSLTVVDVTPLAVTVRQVAADGRELDHFVVTR